MNERSPRGLACVVACGLVALGGCREEPAAVADPAAQQLDLAERVLAWATKSGGANEATREDAALALGEVAIPGHAPRLRMIVSGDDAVLARGAAVALVKILRLRDPSPDALARCVREETNDLVRAECARPSVPVVALAPGALRDSLSRSDPQVQRTALRALLAGSGVAPASLDASLLHAVQSSDPAVRHLAEAVLLRRSLADAPPPAEPLAPRTR